MIKRLPYSGIRFCTVEETRSLSRDFMRYRGKHLDLDGDVGYAVECDLSFPPHLADYFDIFPPLADKRCVGRNEFSPHMLQIAHQYGVPPSREPKLINDLNPKAGYILHAKNLVYVLSLGVKLDRVHRIAQFQQKNWLEPYISFNNYQRTLAGSDSFRRGFFKLLNK